MRDPLDTLGFRKATHVANPHDHRCCIATVLNDDFVLYFQVLLASIQQHNSWFDLPLVIFYGPNRSPLSHDNQQKIVQQYSNVSFREVLESKYDVFKADTPERLLPALYTLETFVIQEYDSVVFLDADMLCQGDISELCTLQVDFAAAPAGKNAASKERRANTFQYRMAINSGVMVIGKRYRTSNNYHQLFKLKSGVHADQNVLTSFFRWKPIYCLDHKYNLHAEYFWQPGDSSPIVHYAGVKPLQEPALPRMQPWFNAAKELGINLPE